MGEMIKLNKRFNMKFGFLNFEIKDEQIYLVGHGDFNTRKHNFAEVQLAGENAPTHMNGKSVRTSESKKFKYVSHVLDNNKLTVIQQTDKVKLTSVFTLNGGAITVYNIVNNISGEGIVLESVPIFVIKELFGKSFDCSKELSLIQFVQGHHSECQPRENSFDELGVFRGNWESQKKFLFASVGSQTTKERLPQGIIKDADSGAHLMFQIEHAGSWLYEIGDFDQSFYLALNTANLNYLGWAKELKQDESYITPKATLCLGGSIDEVVSIMTDYRRSIKIVNNADKNLPTIFNEYMHLSWDSPSEGNTKKIAPFVSKLGIEYYVIDCGWHDEEDGNIIYSYVGKWKESKKRFPNGVRAITDYIRSLGMKAGLWIEPEIVGIKCKEMLDYYDDDCFITRFGKKVAAGDRYFLDYRNKKVRDYMSETIRRMVEDYGADYIKFDYNQDLGVGTDKNAFSFGDGLEQCLQAFLSWVREITQRFPNVVFENCASGGMRLDYRFLSEFSLVSTSDQTNYKKYPYIAGNISSAVLPEQAAVWSYPVDSLGQPNEPFSTDYDTVNRLIDEEQVIFNMINSFLGRMHLASHIELLSERKFELIKEGVEFFNSLTEVKKKSKPFFPCGLSKFGDETVCAGLKLGNEIYLSFWNMNDTGVKTVDIGEKIKNVEIVYPKDNSLELNVEDTKMSIKFTKEYQARFIKIITHDRRIFNEK